MVKTLAQLQKVEGLEPLKPVEVPSEKKTRKIYFIITVEYEYEPKPSIRKIRKFLNKK